MTTNSPVPNARPADAASGAGAREVDVDALLDVPVTLSLEIGRKRMTISQLLQLGQGAIVDLDRGTGEPFDVLVNGRLIARGEVVVNQDKFCIRLLDVISRAERLQNLG